MFIQQIYTGCLAQASYYIESNGEAVIIDPIREPDPYLNLAKARNAKIKYVFETHFHADFVSGHIDIADRTGANIVFGPHAKPAYPAYIARHKEFFNVGNCTIQLLHTPGHTIESSCFLLYDENKITRAIFTGDTLFVGDVGRPDLLDGKMTKEELAGMMYDSLNNKIKNLPDEVIVYPAHGPGSACGKNIGKETWSSIGHQKKTNYALREMRKEEFIKEVTEGLVAPPAYFFSDARINKQGYEAIDAVMLKNLRSLSVDALELEIQSGSMVLDTRDPDVFETGFILGSINIGLNGMFAVWVGTVVDIQKPLVLVCDPGKEEEAVLRLARVGYENVRGYVDGGIGAWKNAGKQLDKIQSVTPSTFAEKVKNGAAVLDVRKFTETEAGHVKGASILPLADLKSNLASVSKNETVYIHCAGGYRSMIAASMMKANGYPNVINVYGGWSLIKDEDVPVETGRVAPKSI